MISSASGMGEASLSNWVWGDIVGGDALGLAPSLFVYGWCVISYAEYDAVLMRGFRNRHYICHIQYFFLPLYREKLSGHIS